MNDTYVIYIKNQAVNVSEEVYREYWKSIEHERYLTKQIRNTWVYLDHLFDEYESNTLEIKLLEDLDPTRNEVLKMERYEALYKAINTLTDDEKDLLIAIYYHDFSDREYAKKLKMNQTTISKRHRSMLRKLKKVLEI